MCGVKAWEVWVWSEGFEGLGGVVCEVKAWEVWVCGVKVWEVCVCVE